jgi:hypothetical protein
MSYDKNGLGIAELTFLAVNYPATFDLVESMLDNGGLELARKFIKAYNEGMIL